MVNKENINHLKCYFGAHETKMKHNMKCSFISKLAYFVNIQSFNPLGLIYNIWVKYIFLITKTLFWVL